MRTIHLHIILLIFAAISPNLHALESGRMIKAAHYFADAWPITFWQEFETARVDADIQRIKRDGFNTVIMAVPWMGFEKGFSGRQTESDQRLYQRLEFMLKKFGEYDLDYILRVGYLHSFTPGIGIEDKELCLRVYSEDRALQHWKDYLRKLRRVTNPHRDGLQAILVSWEDFWCVHTAIHHKTADFRQELAARLGYAEWLQGQDQDVVRIMMGKNEIDYDRLAVPLREDAAYYWYLKFTQELLEERVLQATRSVYPQAALEVRVDRDPVESRGATIWIENNQFLDDRNLRGSYWAPFWSASNVSEKLTKDQALFNFEKFLEYVSDNGTSTRHVIDQFNFFDNTPHYLDNARIEVSSIPPFLDKAAPLIREYSSGYGVWAYRDYADNGLYNASFELDLEGWDVKGEARIVNAVGDKRLSIEAGSSIEQRFEPSKRFTLGWVYDQLQLCFCSDGGGQAAILEGDDYLLELDVKPGLNCSGFDASAITGKTQAEFGFQALSDLVVDNFKLYGFVQSLGVYDEFGRPGRFLEATRRLNGLLDTPPNAGQYLNQMSGDTFPDSCLTAPAR